MSFTVGLLLGFFVGTTAGAMAMAFFSGVRNLNQRPFDPDC